MQPSEKRKIKMDDSKNTHKGNKLFSEPTLEMLEQIEDHKETHPSMDIHAEPWVLPFETPMSFIATCNHSLQFPSANYGAVMNNSVQYSKPDRSMVPRCFDK